MFSGDYDGAPLVRTERSLGSCNTGSYGTNCRYLTLDNRGITSCADDAFSDMGALE